MRTIIAYMRYFLDFYEKQPQKLQAKIEWTLGVIEVLDHVPKKYFSHLTGTELYEVRIEYESNIYRIFAFFDKGYLVVLGNAFQKKSRKTPRKEIERALRIKKEYFDEKQK